MGAVRYVGSNSERQSVGLPGHCEKCAARGHVDAHPELGCSDVGCNSARDEPADVRRVEVVLDPAIEEIRASHTRSWRSTSDEAWGAPGICSQDGHAWPCDTVVVLAALDSRS